MASIAFSWPIGPAAGCKSAVVLKPRLAESVSPEEFVCAPSGNAGSTGSAGVAAAGASPASADGAAGAASDASAAALLLSTLERLKNMESGARPSMSCPRHLEDSSTPRPARWQRYERKMRRAFHPLDRRQPNAPVHGG